MSFPSSTHAKPFTRERLRIHLVLLRMCNMPSHLPTCPRLHPVFLLPKSISHHIPLSITRPLQALQGRQWAFICLTQGPTPSEASGWDNLVSTSSHFLRKLRFNTNPSDEVFIFNPHFTNKLKAMSMCVCVCVCVCVKCCECVKIIKK